MTGQDPEEIQRLFNEVSPTYDLLNRILSLGSDQRWRQAAARELHAKPGDLLLDLCGGTGDLAAELLLRYPDCRVLLVDFAEEMLHLAKRKWCQTHFPTSANVSDTSSASLVAADALTLPLPDQSCAGITVGFGLRNLKDTRAGLVEGYRVLRPGGRLAVLEFMRPQGLLAPVKRFALRCLIPLAVWCVARQHVPAYQYLTCSILSYYAVDEMTALMRAVGFTDVTARRQPLGFAWVIGGTRP